MKTLCFNSYLKQSFSSITIPSFANSIEFGSFPVSGIPNLIV
ncbi:MAG: hypothetical protein HG446_008475 [Flavobacteriaceae bacterium]|nr:hypothetical protein [Flavobacteriaceae bacterium]